MSTIKTGLFVRSATQPSKTVLVMVMSFRVISGLEDFKVITELLCYANLSNNLLFNLFYSTSFYFISSV